MIKCNIILIIHFNPCFEILCDVRGYYPEIIYTEYNITLIGSKNIVFIAIL